MTDNAELDRLRARVAELEGEQAAQPSAAADAPRRHRWRSAFAAILITLSCVLAPFSVISVWASTQMSNTDRYVATMAPLARDPAIQAVVADKVTVAILDRLDTQTLANDALKNLASRPNTPPRLAALLPGLAAPISNGIDGFVGDQVHKAVASPVFAAVWDQANRVAHQQLVKLLEGNQGGVVTAQNGTVTLQLAPLVAAVKQRLLARGFSPASVIPTVNKSVVLVKSEAVTKMQTVYRVLNTVGFWLPIITAVLFLAGVLLAVRRRRALSAGAFGIAGSMLVLGIILAVVRVFYLNAVPADVLPSQAAGDIFDTLIRFLRYSLRSVAVVGLVVGIGAYLVGPGTGAVWTRTTVARGIGWLGGGAERAGLRTGVVGTWTHAYKRWLRVGIVILGALIVVFWSQPTVPVILTVTGVVLLLLAVVEFLGRPPVEPAALGATEATPTLPHQPTAQERTDGEPPPAEERKPEKTRH